MSGLPDEGIRPTLAGRLLSQGRLVLAGLALGLLARWVLGSPVPDPVRRFANPLPAGAAPAQPDDELPDLPLILRDQDG